MIKVFALLIFFIGLLYLKTPAQQLSDPAKEETVKLSGDYFWEEATAKAIDEAKNLSRELLLKRILSDYESNVNINQIKTIQVNGIDYLLYIRGPKYRMIAFVEKKNVIGQLDTLKEMRSVEVIYTEKYSVDTTDNSGQIQIDSNIVTDVNNQKIKVDDTVLDSSLYQKAVDMSHDSITVQNYNVNNDKEFVDKEVVKKGRDSRTEEIRKELSVIKDANEFSQSINKYKLYGKLVYGSKELFNDPYKCDIVIINPETKEILAYLIQIDQKFANYNTNEIFSDYSTTFEGMIAIWIQFFEE